MKNKIKKVVTIVVCYTLMSSFCVSNCFAMLGRGYKLEVHNPHGVTDLSNPKFKNCKRHIHVSKDGKRWSENVDQTPSHGEGNLSDSDDDHTGSYLLSDIKEKARTHPRTLAAKEQEEERQAELRKIERAQRRKAWVEANLDEIMEVITVTATGVVTIAGVTIGISELLEVLSILCFI